MWLLIDAFKYSLDRLNLYVDPGHSWSLSGIQKKFKLVFSCRVSLEITAT